MPTKRKSKKLDLQQASEIMRIGTVHELFPSAYRLFIDFREAHLNPLGLLIEELNNTVGSLGIPGHFGLIRLKPLHSVIEKLRLFPDLTLGEFSDIGGIRYVVDSEAKARAMYQAFINSPHTLADISIDGSYDLIANPDRNGLRLLVLVVVVDGFFFEIQFMTFFQHSWLAGLETYTKLKGPNFKRHFAKSKEKEFFSVASTFFANYENAPVPEPYRFAEVNPLIEKMAQVDEECQILKTLDKAWIPNEKVLLYEGVEDSHWQILSLDSRRKTLHIGGFDSDDLEMQLPDFYHKELAGFKQGREVLLVALSKPEQARHIIPSYFLDGRSFFGCLGSATDEITQEEIDDYD